MTKKPFLLLELLIGITLLSLFAVPLIRDPLFLLQKEVADLEMMELQRISEVKFIQLKEKFYTNELKWEVLAKEVMGEPLIEEVSINLPQLLPHKFQTKTYIWTKKSKESSDKKESYHLVEVKICFFPLPQGKHTKVSIPFSYRFLVKQLPEKSVKDVAPV